MAITTTAVDVAITAPEEDVLGATVEVKDGSGNVVEVNPVDISAGDTVASFTFKTAVDADALVGVWTVDGKEYNFDAINLLTDITEAATANPFNELALYNALEAAGIKNVDDNRLQAYADAIVDASPEVLADVQKAVDAVNKNATETADQAAAVKAVKEATNQIQLLNALKANFERVNDSWIAAYAGGKVGDAVVNPGEEATKGSKAGFIIADTDKTTANLAVDVYGENAAGSASFDNYDFDGIQEILDTINEAQVAAAYDKAFKSLKTADVNAARALANQYLTTAEEEGDHDAKAYANDSLDVLEALIRVNAATTNNTLKSALVALDNLETALVEKYKNNVHVPAVADDFEIKNVNDNLLAEYRKAIADKEVKDKNQRGDIDAIIKQVNQDAVDSAIIAVNNAEGEEAVLKALKAYPGLKNVADVNKDQYVKDIGKGKTAVTKDGTTNQIQTRVNTSNVNAVKPTNAKVSNIIAKLNVLEIKNVVPANAAAYIADAATTKLASASSVENVQDAVNAINKLVTENSSVDEINAATTATEVKAALDKLAIADYVNVPSADKLYVAEKVLKARDSEENKKFADKTRLTTVLGTTSTSGILNAYAGEIAKYTFTNLDNNINKTVGLLEGLDYAAFDNLSAGKKAEVAEAFIANYPQTEAGAPVNYTTLAAVKAGVDKAITAVVE
ncbi:hypothetical protein [Sporosarcina sp. P33]|uniref:hypothetical protein n=1 Tax=Sporosarcina sp. P33 TaxID=1930764 RepID=UPI0009C0C960|nr:hypothetical protein [Sporosarcina sp. P33]ARD48848.1 hypothetical protein SporoP33_11840 [Sporosarcina sp. P33]